MPAAIAYIVANTFRKTQVPSKRNCIASSVHSPRDTRNPTPFAIHFHCTTASPLRVHSRRHNLRALCANKIYNLSLRSGESNISNCATRNSRTTLNVSSVHRFLTTSTKRQATRAHAPKSMVSRSSNSRRELNRSTNQQSLTLPLMHPSTSLNLQKQLRDGNEKKTLLSQTHPTMPIPEKCRELILLTKSFPPHPTHTSQSLKSLSIHSSITLSTHLQTASYAGRMR
mmetsp:Transcript_7009/g.26164  ORF Transcript_7009/g.26164 Transcript_7009/m.26164 type:complete len:227 (-) Transcript_7009:10653-11333(-)